MSNKIKLAVILLVLTSFVITGGVFLYNEHKANYYLRARAELAPLKYLFIMIKEFEDNTGRKPYDDVENFQELLITIEADNLPQLRIQQNIEEYMLAKNAPYSVTDYANCKPIIIRYIKGDAFVLFDDGSIFKIKKKFLPKSGNYTVSRTDRF